MDNYKNELLEWRNTLDNNLRKENSWLALAGLYWLDEGENTFGTNPGNQIVFPRDTGSGVIGSFIVQDEKVTMQVLENVTVMVDGEIVREARLAPDISGSPTEIAIGELVFILIQREDMFGIRLWDNDRPQRSSFPGRQWFPINKKYTFKGTYQRYESERLVTIQQKNLTDIELKSEGIISFSVNSVEYTLAAFEQTDGELFIIFHDQTNGKETYSAGRYLYLKPPEDGMVMIDFNRAYNPPCAFTEYATCPLPPAQNRLDIAVAAGEKKPIVG